MLSFKRTHSDISVLFFTLRITMLMVLEWLGGIGKFHPHPSGKKNLNSPLAASPLVGNSFFFASGFGGNFAMPPRHTHAITSLLPRTLIRN